IFTVGYALVVPLALFPVVQAHLSGATSQPHPVGSALLAAAILLATVGFEAGLPFSLAYCWFGHLAQRDRFLFALELRAALFFGVFLIAGWFVAANLRVLLRPVWPFNATALWIAALLASIVIAAVATSLWIPLMGYMGARATGVVDPVFGRDLSFYLLELPLYQSVTDSLIFVL